MLLSNYKLCDNRCKVKVIPQQAEVAQGVPGRLRPRIFLTFGTTRVLGRQPYAPAAFTSGEIPGTHFKGLSWPQGTWFRRGELRKKSPVTPPGIDPGAVRLVAQRLNHYATPGQWQSMYWTKYSTQVREWNFVLFSIFSSDLGKIRCEILAFPIYWYFDVDPIFGVLKWAALPMFRRNCCLHFQGRNYNGKKGVVI